MAERDRLYSVDGGRSSRGLAAGGGNDNTGGMEARVAKLEDAVGRIDVTLARIDEKMNSLATKSDVYELGKDVQFLKGAMAKMPTTLQLLGFIIAIIVAAGLMKTFAP